ncbi:helix-turn-helix domain-containing protein [Nocardioides sp. DS6]|uniref:Helix-turn-helix domain-containing protein n=1 Tax=Nocardioides eburneus TaxID=3231482 RepID=A0ABV3SZ65_9ACTN
MDISDVFLDLLRHGASEEAFDAAFDDVAEVARARGATAEELDRLRERRAIARQIRERLQRHQKREAELTALFDTANDLIAIRDVDAILAAIVRRARQLLGADLAYLSLNDEAEGASYMRVTDGSVSAEFRALRLPLGTGLLGLVAQRGAPYYTDDYQHDARFIHRDYIDHAVGDEGIRAILGVPLTVEGRVIGALLAGHRSVRAFPRGEVSLLTSFAAHAAVALENARLFQETQAALAELDAANQRISEQAHALELAAGAHDRLTEILLRGGGVGDVAAILGDLLQASLAVYDADGHLVATVDDDEATQGAPDLSPADLAAAAEESRTKGRSVELDRQGRQGRPVYVAAALAGAEHLGTLVLHSGAEPLTPGARRTLERGAVVSALVLLFARAAADAEDRVRGELLTDLLSEAEHSVEALRARARRQGADLDRLGVVAVADVAGDDRHSAARAAARLASELGGLGGEYEGTVVLVAPGQAPRPVGETLSRRLAARLGSQAVTVGVATDPQRRTGPAGVRAAWREARGCLEALHALGRSGEVSDPTGLGLARLLLGHNGPDDLGGFLDDTLGPLVAYDERRGTDLVGTLDAWFAAGGRLAATAQSLHLHANTVSQRLERISRLLGPRWREPDRMLDLQLALRLWRLRSVPR